MAIIITNSAKLFISSNISKDNLLSSGFAYTNTYYVPSILSDSLSINLSNTNSSEISLSDIIDTSSYLAVKKGISTSENTFSFASYVTESTSNILSTILNSSSINNSNILICASNNIKYFSCILLLDASNAIILDKCILEQFTTDLDISTIMSLSFSIKVLSYKIVKYTLLGNNVTLGSITGTLPNQFINSNYFINKSTITKIVTNNGEYLLPITSVNLVLVISREYVNTSKFIGTTVSEDIPVKLTSNSISGSLSVYTKLNIIEGILAKLLEEQAAFPSNTNNIYFVIKGIDNSLCTIEINGCTLMCDTAIDSSTITSSITFQTENINTSASSKISWA